MFRMLNDDREIPAVATSELDPKNKNRRVKILRRSQIGKRWAFDILKDFGTKRCPKGHVVSPALFREARESLGWNKSQAAWKLGFESRGPGPITSIENGYSVPRRFARILMMQALEELAKRQSRDFPGITHGLEERRC